MQLGSVGALEAPHKRAYCLVAPSEPELVDTVNTHTGRISNLRALSVGSKHTQTLIRGDCIQKDLC